MVTCMQEQNRIAGIDEVGRGSVAGPVAAGACVILCELFKRRRSFPCCSPFKRACKGEVLIADSKLLSTEEREQASARIAQHCVTGIGMVEASMIDAHGILAATNQAMLIARGR